MALRAFEDGCSELVVPNLVCRGRRSEIHAKGGLSVDKGHFDRRHFVLKPKVYILGRFLTLKPKVYIFGIFWPSIAIWGCSLRNKGPHEKFAVFSFCKAMEKLSACIITAQWPACMELRRFLLPMYCHWGLLPPERLAGAPKNGEHMVRLRQIASSLWKQSRLP